MLHEFISFNAIKGGELTWKWSLDKGFWKSRDISTTLSDCGGGEILSKDTLFVNWSEGFFRKVSWYTMVYAHWWDNPL